MELSQIQEAYEESEEITMATYKQGEKKVSTREKKRLIMSVHGWTADQYRKQYDLFKNKLRAYESFRQAHGAEVKPQSPQELLYKQAKAMKREGSEYSPSLEMKRIQAFSAVSITKGRKLAKEMGSKYTQHRKATFASTTNLAFRNFIEKVEKAQEIVISIDDPVKQEEALKALAEHIHAKQQPKGEVFAGEQYGSDPAGDDFDYGQWLD